MKEEIVELRKPEGTKVQGTKVREEMEIIDLNESGKQSRLNEPSKNIFYSKKKLTNLVI